MRASNSRRGRYGEGSETSEPSEGACSCDDISERAALRDLEFSVGDGGGEDEVLALKL